MPDPIRLSNHTRKSNPMTFYWIFAHIHCQNQHFALLHSESTTRPAPLKTKRPNHDSCDNINDFYAGTRANPTASLTIHPPALLLRTGPPGSHNPFTCYNTAYRILYRPRTKHFQAEKRRRRLGVTRRRFTPAQNTVYCLENRSTRATRKPRQVESMVHGRPVTCIDRHLAPQVNDESIQSRARTDSSILEATQLSNKYCLSTPS